MAAEFLAADTVGMQLCMNDARQLWGAERKTFAFGPWRLDIWQECHSDCVEKKELGMWCSLTGRIWLYFWIGMNHTYVLAVDGKALGVAFADRQTFAGGSPKATIRNIFPAVRAVFSYLSDEERWRRVPNSTMDFPL